MSAGGSGAGGMPGGGTSAGGMGGTAEGGTGGTGGTMGCSPDCSNGFDCTTYADCTSKLCDTSVAPAVCAACTENADCSGSGGAWKCVTGVCTDAGPKDLGEPCSAGSDCASSNCVDDVCCDTTCGGGATDDCVACSAAAGAFDEGTCGPRVSGAACGDPADSDCNHADTCDGAGTCETHVPAAGSLCTGDGLFCTGVDTCDGSGMCVSPGPSCSMLEICDEAASYCRPNVWINEIHYDNVDPDADEGFELAGQAGVDVTGFSVWLYDSASGFTLGAIGPLGEVVADESNGFGTLAYPFPGLPDGNFGYALVDEANKVVQFISFGGVVSAVDGPAMGTMSVDIGFSEDGTNAAGTSLQLTGGPGNDVSDFTWTIGPTSLGAVNAGQSF